jgi:hypothetical protein
MKNCSARRISFSLLLNPKALPSSKAARSALISMNLGSDAPQSSSFVRDQPGKMSSTFHAVLNILPVLCSSFLVFIRFLAVSFFLPFSSYTVQAQYSDFRVYLSDLHNNALGLHNNARVSCVSLAGP